MLGNLFLTIIETLGSLLSGVLLARFVMQWQRVSFRNPIGQFVLATTDWVVVPLRRPTADTGKLVWAAAAGMRRMYEPGYKMAKAGVMLLDLVPGSVLQGELDLEEEDRRDRTKLMVALDTLNQRYGKGTVHSGATGGTNKGKDWGMKQERRTPQYTTRWEDVPVARA